MTRPRIALTGATGRTGNAVAHGLVGRDDVELVACVAPSLVATPSRQIPAGVSTAGALGDVTVPWDILVDLTVADVACENVRTALEAGKSVVLGTTGIGTEQLEELGDLATQRGCGLLYVPNFSLAAVLLMQIARDLARHFPAVEIVETHHDTKLDSPSGTAQRTAQLLAEAGAATPGPDAPARGVNIDGVRVHSLRLPGATAHQEVIFGAPGELLTLRHDAIDRSCYAAGVARAVCAVTGMQGLEIGLERAL